MGREKNVLLTVKLPKNLVDELKLKVPKGKLSTFIRDAIIDKIQKTPAYERLEDVEKRLFEIENLVGKIVKALAEIGVKVYDKNESNIYSFCRDEVDKKIVNLLVKLKGASTNELAKHLGLNRWLILNRLKRISTESERKLGKPLVSFLSLEKMGKKRAWWINEEMVDAEVKSLS